MDNLDSLLSSLNTLFPDSSPGDIAKKVITFNQNGQQVLNDSDQALKDIVGNLDTDSIMQFATQLLGG